MISEYKDNEGNPGNMEIQVPMVQAGRKILGCFNIRQGTMVTMSPLKDIPKRYPYSRVNIEFENGRYDLAAEFSLRILEFAEQFLKEKGIEADFEQIKVSMSTYTVDVNNHRVHDERQYSLQELLNMEELHEPS